MTPDEDAARSSSEATAPGSIDEAVDAEAFFSALAARTPEPQTELAYTDAFTLLVAVVLSAQATDIGVNKATHTLFARARTPAAMIALGEEGIREHIKSLGLFNQKAKNVLALSERLVEEHGGHVPADRDALERLPGVGRKTANVVLCEAFDVPAIAVDTHVFRVCNRTGIAPGSTPLEVEKRLMQVVPGRFLRGAHHWLILHGRYVCRARKPACATCAVRSWCLYPDKAPSQSASST